MTFGEHPALVDEVIDFAFGGRVLFAVGFAEETVAAWITDDLRLALEANSGSGEISRFRMAPHGPMRPLRRCRDQAAWPRPNSQVARGSWRWRSEQ